MYFRQLFNRALGTRQELIPAVCYSVCQNLYQLGAELGKSRALCDSPDYATGLDDCYACANANQNASNLSGGVNLAGTLQEYIIYCDEQTHNSQAALVTSLLAEISALQHHTVTKNVTVTPTAAPTQNPATQTPSSTSNPGSNPTSKSTSHAWISGAVIGPIVLLLAIGAMVIFVRKRRRQQDTPLPRTVDSKEKDGFLQDKAQLHSDSMVRHELDSTTPGSEPSELPVAERPGELEQTV